MTEKTLAQLIANSNFLAIKKLVEDGLIEGGDSIEIPFGTWDVCSNELLDEIKGRLKQEGYQVNILSRPVPPRRAMGYKAVEYRRFLIVRRAE